MNTLKAKISSIHTMPDKPPHKFFSRREKSVLRTLICADDTREWYTLPGPAKWWPASYDFAKRGFEPEKNKQLVAGRKRALGIFLRAIKVSAKTFEAMQWDAEEFIVL
jgi:hypothetical protein